MWEELAFDWRLARTYHPEPHLGWHKTEPCQVNESYRISVSRKNDSLGRAYSSKSVFKLSLVPEKYANENGKHHLRYSLSYLSLWHGMVGRVHYKKIKKMMRCDLLSNYGGEELDKCEVCPQTKRASPSRYTLNCWVLYTQMFVTWKGLKEVLHHFYITSLDTIMCSSWGPRMKLLHNSRSTWQKLRILQKKKETQGVEIRQRWWRHVTHV